MVAVTAIVRGPSTEANISEQEMSGLKMKMSPALSFVSTVALSDAAEMWDFSDDDDDNADVSSVDPPWGAIGSCHPPVFASLEGGHEILANSARNTQWGDVGARLADVMKEAMESNDSEEILFSESVHCVDEQAWHLVGLRLGRLFSSFDIDGESTLVTANPDEVLGISIKDSSIARSESHHRWHAVGSGLAAVLKAAET